MINTSSRFTERQLKILDEAEASPEFREFTKKVQTLFDWNSSPRGACLLGVDMEGNEWKLLYTIQVSEHSGVTPVINLCRGERVVEFFGLEQSDQLYFAKWWACVEGIAYRVDNENRLLMESSAKTYFNNVRQADTIQ